MVGAFYGCQCRRPFVQNGQPHMVMSGIDLLFFSLMSFLLRCVNMELHVHSCFLFARFSRRDGAWCARRMNRYS